MLALRREDPGLYLTGAAAACCIVSISVSQILMGAAVLALMVARQRWRVPPVWLPFSLFLTGTLISLAASGHIRAGFPQVKKFYVYLMLFLVTTAFRNVWQVRWLALAWALAALLSAGLSLYQFIGKYEDAQDAHQNFYVSYVASRITGFMSHWMTFSGEMMIVLLVIAAVIFFSNDRRWIAWLVAVAALLSTALMATHTRSVWLGVAAGGLYLIWFWRRWVVAAAPVLMGIVLLINPFEVRERVVSAFHPHAGDLDSNAHRAMCRAIGYQMIKAHPWLGIGPEQVQYQYLQYLPPGSHLPLPAGYYGHLHNIYVHYAAELGIPTMLALLWMLARGLFDFVRSLRRLPALAEQRWVLHAAIAVTIAVLISGYYEKNLGDSEVLGIFLAVMGSGYVAVMQGEAECKA